MPYHAKIDAPLKLLGTGYLLNLTREELVRRVLLPLSAGKRIELPEQSIRASAITSVRIIYTDSTPLAWGKKGENPAESPITDSILKNGTDVTDKFLSIPLEKLQAIATDDSELDLKAICPPPQHFYQRPLVKFAGAALLIMLGMQLGSMLSGAELSATETSTSQPIQKLLK